MAVVGIYLAAGQSRRMGENKLALQVGKMTLGSLALDTAIDSALDQIFVVTNADDELYWIPSRMRTHKKCTILPCPNSNEGQSVSLQCGIKHAMEHGASAAIVLLADQPFITKLMINEMINCFNQNPNSQYVATASYDGLMKPPILFSSSLFPALLNIRGDKGAREIIRGRVYNQGKRLPCEDHRLLFDVDTPEDYNSLLSHFKEA
ncbi:nucleotidyltransferase family protein [Sporosarcina thermotolerans]|uniref:Nucleotidyltransferase family protein n=1 Tax=Sporosarcina thermotolerans TaxID=633404 RepID=A0AAW9A6W1_9BACL|nr:nucleotidyltransferase family protein [Sporosarcina thermotolerans]MDW0115453.1 nucleotidyltransferase family protein [Sporosarcina thermotolerans]WHT47219.1 nucleotidyltransferase family protein [Sporosarcina thermotolerans]